MKLFSLVTLYALCLMLASPVPGMAAQNPQQQASAALVAKNIRVDSEGFIKEITAGNSDNVRLFLNAGYFAGSQNDVGTSALMAALNSPTEEVFNLLLSTIDQGASGVLDLYNKEGNTALHIALRNNKTQQAAALIERGASVGIANAAGITPLMLAAQSKQVAIAETIIRTDKTAITAEDARGNSALTYAIQLESPAITKLLLEAGASASAADSIGITPLMLAAKTGNETIVSLLLEKGADVTSVSKSGESVLSIAAANSFTQLAIMLSSKVPTGSKLLLPALNAALNAEKTDAMLFETLLKKLDSKDIVPPSLLFKALDHKQGDIARLLVAALKDVNLRNDQNETLFYHSVDAGFEDIALELINRGAEITQSGTSGASTINRAVRHNMAKVVQILLDKGASADQKTAEGYTLAEMCVYSGYPETLEVLMKKGVKIDKEFALLWSIRDGKGKAAPVLLAHGAVPDIMNQNGTPAITLAAEAGQIEAIQGFITYKATLDYPSKSRGITALGAAALGGHLEIVKALVEAGADIEKADNGGMTPLAHAASLSRLSVVEYLVSKGANPKTVDAQKRTVSDIAALAPASTDREKVLQLLSDTRK